ncbi:MAG: filamentous hemagglutinin N-terminal domain-containing protein, partial [Planctomycetota bacterium]
MSTHSRKGAGQSKLGRLMIAGPLVGLMSVPALAGPEGEQVVHGSAQFTRQGNLTTITTSHRAIINYSSFDLASWESVRFLQPNANSRVLNRIQSGVPTHIDGSITANGSVYFVNNAGIVFGPNAVLNVGSLFAAAGNISNRDFIDGRNRFTDLTGDVVNHGRIEAGQVGLLGRRVANYGQIVAPEGVVTFGSGEEVFIGQRGSHVFARITSTDEGIDGGIEQGGSITAREVNLSVGDHFALATFDESDIRAQRVTIRGGDESTVTVSGSIDVTRQGDRGGRVDIFGDTILLNGASIDASGDLGGGVVRIGGDYQGQGLSPHARYTLV